MAIASHDSWVGDLGSAERGVQPWGPAGIYICVLLVITSRVPGSFCTVMPAPCHTRARLA